MSALPAWIAEADDCFADPARRGDARGWPDPWPGRFGHHEIWHLFVLAGAGAYYAFAYSLVELPHAPF